MHIQPRPNESTYSLLARAHAQMGSQNPATSLLHLTGKRGFKPLSGLPTGSSEVVRRIGASIDVDEWINNHTLFPLYRPFIPPERIGFVRDGLIENGATKSRLGLLRSHCGAMEQLAYCPRCIDLAINRYGHGYWSRGHQIVGILTCARHRLPLHRINVEELSWKSRALVMPGGGGAMRVEDGQVSRLEFVAEQLGEIINEKTDVTISHGSYVDILRSAGLYTAKGRVRGRRLTCSVRRWLAPIKKLPPFDRLWSAVSVERNWAITTVANDGGFTHPIKHVVVWGAIGCEWRDLVNAASTRGHQRELDLRFTSSTSAPDSIALETLHRVGTLTAAASELGCDVTTMAVWADRIGWSRNRKPKKVTVELRTKIEAAIRNGDSSAEIARQFDVSVPTVNRIKRTLGP